MLCKERKRHTPNKATQETLIEKKHFHAETVVKFIIKENAKPLVENVTIVIN